MSEEIKTAEQTNNSTAAPEVNDLAPPPAPTATTQPGTSEKPQESTEAKSSEALPAVKQAPAIAPPDPINTTSTIDSTNADKNSTRRSNSETNNDSGQVNELHQVPVVHSQHEKHAHHEHRNNKKFAALLVIIIGLILSAGAVYIYVSTQDNAKEADTQTNNVQQQNTDNESAEQITPATPESIDQAIEDIDQTFKSMDNEADFGEDQLSDETLGL